MTTALLLFAFLLADRLLPLPPTHADGFSSLITARDGSPLRAFPDRSGVWRYPVQVNEVSLRYLEALLGYEDRWFYYHPGVNPLSILRAAWQNLSSGRVVSGGSTLTMQVARLLDPHSRTLSGKLRQLFRALQLEWYLDKQQILELYLNLAPYGGTIEGIQAASYAYLGKSAARLSDAEAALLAVLPQAPTRLRIDRHPERARMARDKVLRRLAKLGIWSQEAVEAALLEPVVPRGLEQPMLAPLLARRLKPQAQAKGGHLRTTLDGELQGRFEQLIRRATGRFPPRTSLALLLVENDTLAVRAYVGSADFFANERAGQVDMVTAVRSPGSTLKPFLYGLALDAGLIHSQSLLADVPGAIDGYQPGNFSLGYSGAVSVTQALQRSLNIPAVALLSHYGVGRFAARLRNAGLRLELPRSEPSLAMILGGVGTTLESLVEAYTALANRGLAGRLRYSEDEPLQQRRLLSEGAAWIVRDILSQQRPALRFGLLSQQGSRALAWKTGTSYGYRDAFAIGVTDRYTLGVWVGRPDGTPTPGSFGALSAVPLLFAAVDMLPGRRQWAAASRRPATIEEAEICWPMGVRRDSIEPHLCARQQTAWLLDGVAPPTLRVGRDKAWLGGEVRYWVNPENGLRVNATCAVAKREPRSLARWPVALQPWLAAPLRQAARLPGWDPHCEQTQETHASNLQLQGMADLLTLHQSGPAAASPLVEFTPVGGSGRLYWLVDGVMVGSSAQGAKFAYRFMQHGRHEMTVFDAEGNHDRLVVDLIE